MTKTEIADILDEIGTLLELKGENPFKIRAYQTGARAVEALEEAELDQLIRDQALDSIKGIGAALAEKITSLRKTGTLEFFDMLKASVPPGHLEMLQIPGLGPKKIQAVSKKLGVHSVAELKQACESGKIADLEGFGAKSQEKILAGIRNRDAYGKRHLWWDAAQVSQRILEGLRALPQVVRAEAAGSLRRGLETVGDLDFLVSAAESAPIMDWFASQPGVVEVTAKGETKTSVRFEGGLQADLRLVPDEQFPFALHHFTGSKDHNVQMRQRALERGLSLSEWGLVPAEGEGTAKEKAAKTRQKPVKTEAELFSALGLHFIPPELREGLGEIEEAAEHAFPPLVEVSQLRGAFHNHTTASDGRNTLTEMAAAAEALGWEYLGIADHSKSSFQANGLSEARLREQIEEIRALNASKRFSTYLFAGSEVDILPDGSLDFPDSLLKDLDYVVCSVHNVLNQEPAAMTARIERALANPYCTILGHLSGRILLRREPSQMDVSRIVAQAIEHQVILELNASPYRLDLDWRVWRKLGKDSKLLCAINPDAHEVSGLQHVRAGVNAARKGALGPARILNTRPLAEVQAYFRTVRKQRLAVRR